MDTATNSPNPITLTVVQENVAPPIGHYSHVVELGNGMIFLSGQKAWHPVTGALIEGDIKEQTHLIFDNIEAIMRGIGLTREAITRVSCHLADVRSYEIFNEAYAARLGRHKPARTVLAGYALRGGALVELVVDAYRTPPTNAAPM